MYSLDAVANFMRRWLRNMFPLIFSKLRAFGASVHHTNFSHLQLSPSANRRMGAQTHEILHSQWRFTISSLSATPSATTSAMTLDKELYERAKGVEFLYRLGASLQLSVSPALSFLQDNV